VLAQTLAAPGQYQYCLSAYVRSAAPGAIGLIVGGETVERPVGPEWSRVVFVANGDAEAESVRFGLEVTAATTVEVYGIQVEPQGGASVYKATTRGGVYEDSHLSGDELVLTCTGMNRHSCTVNIFHANHI
jgi:hypothetical protein